MSLQFQNLQQSSEKATLSATATAAAGKLSGIKRSLEETKEGEETDDFDKKLEDIFWMSTAAPSSPLSSLSSVFSPPPSSPLDMEGTEILLNWDDADWCEADEVCYTDNSTSSASSSSSSSSSSSGANVAKSYDEAFAGLFAKRAANAAVFLEEVIAWKVAEKNKNSKHYKNFNNVKTNSSCKRNEYIRYGFDKQQKYLDYLNVLLYIDFTINQKIGDPEYYKFMKNDFMSKFSNLLK